MADIEQTERRFTRVYDRFKGVLREAIDTNPDHNDIAVDMIDEICNLVEDTTDKLINKILEKKYGGLA